MLTIVALDVNTLTIAQFKEEVKDGKMFSVAFRRKTDKKVGGVVVEPAGTIREMVARTGVQKGVKGVIAPEVRKAEDAENNVLTVYDMAVLEAGKDEKGAFRRINLSDLLTVKLHGKTYNWNEAAQLLVQV